MMRICCLLLFLLYAMPVAAQMPGKVLMADRYGKKRIKIVEGSELWFRLKGEKLRQKDYIYAIKDSTIVLSKSNYELPISEIERLYFRRKNLSVLGPKLTYMGLGFLAASAVHRPGYYYSKRESAIIGWSFIALWQVLRPFKIKKFTVKENSRLRIIDLSMRPAGQ